MVKPARNKLLIWAALALFAYALLGNYLALPGYVRFLERGGRSEAGNAFDLSVAVGAAKTIVWMFSFQLGVLCLAAVYARRHGLPAGRLLVGLLVWLALWAWPTLPAPGAAFYIVFGSIILAAIATTFARGEAVGETRLRRTLFLASLVFFAFATWEICGLGSTGRMLHPEQAASPIAHNLLTTQSSKLMIELVLAWAFMALSLVLGRARAPA